MAVFDIIFKNKKLIYFAINHENIPTGHPEEDLCIVLWESLRLELVSFVKTILSDTKCIHDFTTSKNTSKS